MANSAHSPDSFAGAAMLGTLARLPGEFWKEIVAVGVFSMVANVLMLSPTLYMLQIYDRVIVSGSELTLVAVSLVTLFLFAAIAFAEWARSRLLVRAGMRLDALLGSKIFVASFEASLRQAALQLSRPFNDLVNVRQFLTGQAIFALFDAPWTPVYMLVLFFLHPWLGVLALCFALAQLMLGFFGHRHTHAPFEASAKSLGDANAYLQSKLRNAEVLESMGMVGHVKRHWAARHADFLAQSVIAQRLTNKITAWSKWVRYSQQSLALGAGALLVIDGQLSPGGMIAANVLMVRALAPIDQMVSVWRNFTMARTAYGRLDRLMAQYPESHPAPPPTLPHGELQLKAVHVSLPSRENPILADINLVFPQGSVTALLGPSGSGKSTLARVMTGIWPDAKGEVLLGGIPINSWSFADRGPHIGYLPQDIELFDGTIAENIARFAVLNPPQVIEAARCTGLHEMILRFPKGYDTPVGEAGGLLSGGQRQRIGLARAIYGDPALIVLDEPNANLDDVGEIALSQTIATLKSRGKTLVLITHRPAALTMADRGILLFAGRVRAQGTRDEVLTILHQLPAASGPGAVESPALPTRV